VGFAAETDRLRDYALGKLENKKLDMIVANLVGAGRGFEAEDNAAEVFWAGGERSFPLMSKTALAKEIVGLVGSRFRDASGAGAARQAAATGD